MTFASDRLPALRVLSACERRASRNGAVGPAVNLPSIKKGPGRASVPDQITVSIQVLTDRSRIVEFTVVPAEYPLQSSVAECPATLVAVPLDGRPQGDPSVIPSCGDFVT
jgi:hypothetical protein